MFMKFNLFSKELKKAKQSNYPIYYHSMIDETSSNFNAYLIPKLPMEMIALLILNQTYYVLYKQDCFLKYYYHCIEVWFTLYQYSKP